MRDLELFFFHELLDWHTDGRFFFMPRFVRDLCENGKEVLSMNEVMSFLLRSNVPLVEDMDLIPMLNMSQSEWQQVADQVKGMLVTQPGTVPACIRVDQLDREQDSASTIKYPEIVHFGVKPPQLSYAGNQVNPPNNNNGFCFTNWSTSKRSIRRRGGTLSSSATCSPTCPSRRSRTGATSR